MPLTITREDGLYLSDQRELLDVDRIYGWLDASYWARGRPRELVERSLTSSWPVGAYTTGGEQVAIARATTDYATFAWIGDVYVDEAWRGKGVGSWLVGTLVAELEAIGVPRVVLATRDAHEVYARLGFEPLRIPELWMEIDRRPTRPDRADLRR